MSNTETTPAAAPLPSMTEQAHVAALLHTHVSTPKPAHKRLAFRLEDPDNIEIPSEWEAGNQTVAALELLREEYITKRTRKWSYRFVNWFNNFGKL